MPGGVPGTLCCPPLPGCGGTDRRRASTWRAPKNSSTCPCGTVCSNHSRYWMTATASRTWARPHRHQHPPQKTFCRGVRRRGWSLRERLAAAPAPCCSSPPWPASPGSSCPPAASPAKEPLGGHGHPVPSPRSRARSRRGVSRPRGAHPHLGDDPVEAVGGVLGAEPDGDVALGVALEVGTCLAVVVQLHAERPRAGSPQGLPCLRRQPPLVHEQAAGRTWAGPRSPPSPPQPGHGGTAAEGKGLGGWRWELGVVLFMGGGRREKKGQGRMRPHGEVLPTLCWCWSGACRSRRRGCRGCRLHGG